MSGWDIPQGIIRPCLDWHFSWNYFTLWLISSINRLNCSVVLAACHRLHAVVMCKKKKKKKWLRGKWLDKCWFDSLRGTQQNSSACQSVILITVTIIIIINNNNIDEQVFNPNFCQIFTFQPACCASLRRISIWHVIRCRCATCMSRSADTDNR